MTLDNRSRWIALYVLCLGDLMIVLDGTIVNVALPSIRDDLGFSQESLAWIVNAYLLTFGGFLLLGGRLGDLFGHRRLFLIGIALFTAASLACGLANSQETLIVGRAIQGVGGAIVSAVALSLLMLLFTETADRAKAMGVFGFVLSGGGVIGVLAGGILTDFLSWHWIFFINLPVGIAVFVLSLRLLPAEHGPAATGKVDYAGAITVTAALMLAVYAIVNGNEEGWTSVQTLGMLGLSAALIVVFLVIESRVSSPLVPLSLFRNRNVSTSNVVGVLMAAGMFSYFFFSALYLQLVLEYSPLEVGLAYLPGTVIWGVSSLFLSQRLVMRYGIKPPLLAGLGLMTLALVLLARTPVDGNWAIDILPATIALGIGAGIAFNPILLAAMSGVGPEQAGLASGVVNTSFMMGGAVGLAILASLAASRSDNQLASGEDSLVALNSGYHLAFLVGALFLLAAGRSARRCSASRHRRRTEPRQRTRLRAPSRLRWRSARSSSGSGSRLDESSPSRRKPTLARRHAACRRPERRDATCDASPRGALWPRARRARRCSAPARCESYGGRSSLDRRRRAPATTAGARTARASHSVAAVQLLEHVASARARPVRYCAKSARSVPTCSTMPPRSHGRPRSAARRRSEVGRH